MSQCREAPKLYLSVYVSPSSTHERRACFTLKKSWDFWGRSPFSLKVIHLQRLCARIHFISILNFRRKCNIVNMAWKIVFLKNPLWNTSFWNICDRIRSNFISFSWDCFTLFSTNLGRIEAAFSIEKNCQWKKCLDSGHLLCVHIYMWTLWCGSGALWSMDNGLVVQARVSAQLSFNLPLHCRFFSAVLWSSSGKLSLLLFQFFSIELEIGSP